MKTICCPFCGEDAFDIIGLKAHLIFMECNIFNGIEVQPRKFK